MSDEEWAELGAGFYPGEGPLASLRFLSCLSSSSYVSVVSAISAIAAIEADLPVQMLLGTFFVSLLDFKAQLKAKHEECVQLHLHQQGMEYEV